MQKSKLWSAASRRRPLESEFAQQIHMTILHFEIYILNLGSTERSVVRPHGVTNRLVSGSGWEATLQRVIVPYTKTKRLYGCSS